MKRGTTKRIVIEQCSNGLVWLCCMRNLRLPNLSAQMTGHLSACAEEPRFDRRERQAGGLGHRPQGLFPARTGWVMRFTPRLCAVWQSMMLFRLWSLCCCFSFVMCCWLLLLLFLGGWGWQGCSNNALVHNHDQLLQYSYVQIFSTVELKLWTKYTDIVIIGILLYGQNIWAWE